MVPSKPKIKNGNEIIIKNTTKQGDLVAPGAK